MEYGQAPVRIARAVETGSIAEVEAWLDSGGDPNASGRASGRYPLLLGAARYGKLSMVELLLSRGADIDATDRAGRTAVYETLNYWSPSLATLKLLLSHGADVNLALHGHQPGLTALMIGTVGSPDMLRLLLRAGADSEHRTCDGRTAEEFARARAHEASSIVESADFLRDVRLAGGWTRYFLRPHYDLLVLRALCHRGRATFSVRTPEVFVRLFGAPDGRHRKYTMRGRVDLPDPLFWRVLEFAVGSVYDYPWVRQRVRARAARRGPAAES